MKFLVPIVLSLATMGCMDKSAPATESAPTEHEQHSERAEGLRLDNGRKWPANAETTAAIANMRALVEGYLNSGESNAQILQQELEEEFASLVRQCTMQGEAHDQLHFYILPLKGRIKNLDNANGREDVEGLAGYLGKYGTYFE